MKSTCSSALIIAVFSCSTAFAPEIFLRSIFIKLLLTLDIDQLMPERPKNLGRVWVCVRVCVGGGGGQRGCLRDKVHISKTVVFLKVLVMHGAGGLHCNQQEKSKGETLDKVDALTSAQISQLRNFVQPVLFLHVEFASQKDTGYL